MKFCNVVNIERIVDFKSSTSSSAVTGDFE